MKKASKASRAGRAGAKRGRRARGASSGRSTRSKRAGAGWRAGLARVQPLALLRGTFFVAVVGALLVAGHRLLDVPVTQVTMEGPFRRVSYGEVEAILRDELPAGFLSADLERLRRRVQAVPWVDVARIRRVWPDGILVHLTEQVAVARWGESGLLNSRGELFVRDSRHVLPELPRLHGPEGSEEEVSQRYLDYGRQLELMGFDLLALTVDARGAWNARVNGGDGNPVEVRLGRRDPDGRLRRFVETAGDLVRASAERIEYVDMRYGNGFAVGWRPSSVAGTGASAERGAHGTES